MFICRFLNKNRFFTTFVSEVLTQPETILKRTKKQPATSNNQFLINTTSFSIRASSLAQVWIKWVPQSRDNPNQCQSLQECYMVQRTPGPGHRSGLVHCISLIHIQIVDECINSLKKSWYRNHNTPIKDIFLTWDHSVLNWSVRKNDAKLLWCSKQGS